MSLLWYNTNIESDHDENPYAGMDIGDPQWSSKMLFHTFISFKDAPFWTCILCYIIYAVIHSYLNDPVWPITTVCNV